MAKTARRVAAIVLCLLFVIAVLSSCAASSPKSLVKKYVKALNKADYNAYLECFDPDTRKDLKEYYTKEDFKEDCADEGKISVKVNGVEYSDDKTEATLDVTVKVDGETHDTDLYCFKVDGKWYIDD